VRHETLLIRKRFILLGILLAAVPLAIDSSAADLIFQAAPTFSKLFGPNPALLGDNSDYRVTFRIDNTASGVVADDLDFTDNLPAGMVVASPPSVTVKCAGGTLTATAGSGVISYTGGSVAAGGLCDILVNVTTSVRGTFNNVTGDLTSTLGNSGTASDTLTVLPLGFTKAFIDDPVAAGGTVTLEFTLTNPTAVPHTGITFTDDLDAVVPGLTTTGLPAADVCGSGSTLSGTSVLTLSDGSLSKGGSCTFSVTLQVPAGAAAGSYPNTTSDPSLESKSIGDPATDTLVIDPPPSFAKAFSPASIGSGGTSALAFTIDNTAGSAAGSSLDFTDNLPAGVTVASPANASTTCTGGTLTAASGSAVISYSGGSVAAGSSCTVSVDTTSSTVGSHVNTTGDLTSSLGNSGTASDTLTVEPPPGFSKAFAPDTITTGATSTLTFTIDNSSGAGDATSLDFTDNLPAGTTVASPANASTSCTGGTLTAASGSAVISYTGGTAGAGATCTVTVDVTSSTAGMFNNTSGDLTSSLGNSGTASDTLTVMATMFDVPSSSGSGNITGSISDLGGTCSLNAVVATTAAAVAGAGPPGVTFPHELIDFDVDSCSPGDTVTFTVVYPDPLPAGTQYWKYGPTPSDATPHWYTIPAAIAGNTVTFTITDGDLGDDDLAANGTIDDPGGGGVAAAVPTMPEWALIFLALLLLTAALWARRAAHFS